VLGPDFGAMQRIDDELLRCAPDGQPHIRLGEFSLRRSAGCLVLVSVDGLDLSQNKMVLKDWHQKMEAQQLKEPLLCLSEHGSLVRAHEGNPVMGLQQGDVLEVRYRAGSERCKPLGRAHSQTLKKLLQEAKVPAWQRSALPLFYLNGELAMVANLWVNAGFEAPSIEAGWGWQKPVKNAAFDCPE